MTYRSHCSISLPACVTCCNCEGQQRIAETVTRLLDDYPITAQFRTVWKNIVAVSEAQASDVYKSGVKLKTSVLGPNSRKPKPIRMHRCVLDWNE